MRLVRLNPPSRCLALVFALILGIAASVVTFPATAHAGCMYVFFSRIYYYSDPELTQYVGQCVHTCDGETTCSGEQTDYLQIVNFSRCPYPICS